VNPVGVLDCPGLLALFERVAGRRFLGAVGGGGYVELVFSDPDKRGHNLVSVCVYGRNAGLVFLGHVADPEEYVADYRRLREAA
jgi:hypothetical protein